MTVEEAKKAFEELKAQGETDDDILKVLYVMYQNDQFGLEELESFVNILGYEFTDEFKAMSDEDKKTKGLEAIEDDEEENVEKPEENAEDNEKVNNESMLYTGLYMSECSEEQIEESRKYDENTDSYLEDVRDESSLYPIDFIWNDKYKMWICED